MKKLFSSTNIRSMLAWLIKLGTMGFNLPATMGVIGKLVTNVTAAETALKPVVVVVMGTTISSDNLLLYLLILSGVVVLDTVFLASWYELDTNKAQDDSDKLADAITVVVMYILTIVVGLLHGEGLAGLLFRIPMGIAVARSTWKTISYSMRRTGDDTKGKNMPLRVRLEQMKALTTKGVALVQYEVNQFIEDLKVRQDIEKAHRDEKKKAGVSAASAVASIYSEQAVADAKSGSIRLVEAPSLNSRLALPTSNSNSTPAVSPSTSSSSQKYNISQEGDEWIATCLHPGCSTVVRNGSKDSVRRKIVGHGNKHKNMPVETPVEIVEVVEGELVKDDMQGF